MVCSWQLSLLPKFRDYIDDDVAVYMNLENRCVHREWSIWLENMKQNHVSGFLECKEYIVGDYALWHKLDHREGEFWIEKFRQIPVSGMVNILCFDLAEVQMMYKFIDLVLFCHIVEIASSLDIDSLSSSLHLEDCCEFVYLVSLECEDIAILVLIFGRLRMIHTTASIAALLVVALLFFLHIKLEVLRLNGQFKKMVILRVTHKIVAESSVIQQTKFQDVFLSVTVNSVYKYLMKLFSVHVLHLLSYHVCGFLLPQNGLQPLAIQMLLLVIVVLHLRLQTQNYGQGDAEGSDYFAELRFFFDYHAFLQ